MGHQAPIHWAGIGLVSAPTTATSAAQAQVHAHADATAPAAGHSPVDALGNAPGTKLITIIINSLIADWTCKLDMLGIGVVLEVGRRSRRSPSLMLTGFFCGNIVFVGIPGATAIAVQFTSA